MSYCAAAEPCQQTLEQEGYGGSGEINREGSSRFLESCGQAGCGAEIASTDPADMTDNSDGDDGGDADGDGSAAGAWQEGSGLEEAEDAPAGDDAAAAGCCWEDSMTPEAGGTTVSGCSELASQAQQVHGGSDATTEVEAQEFDLEAAFAAVAAATAAAAAAACAGVHICMVDDCDVDLAELKPYFRRSKVCPTHQSAPSVNLNGVACRYCQQCTRCHPVSEFDGTKRSCRSQLLHHNRSRKHRRRATPGSFYSTKRARPKSAAAKRKAAALAAAARTPVCAAATAAAKAARAAATAARKTAAAEAAREAAAIAAAAAAAAASALPSGLDGARHRAEADLWSVLGGPMGGYNGMGMGALAGMFSGPATAGSFTHHPDDLPAIGGHGSHEEYGGRGSLPRISRMASAPPGMVTAASLLPQQLLPMHGSDGAVAMAMASAAGLGALHGTTAFGSPEMLPCELLPGGTGCSWPQPVPAASAPVQAGPAGTTLLQQLAQARSGASAPGTMMAGMQAIIKSEEEIVGPASSCCSSRGSPHMTAAAASAAAGLTVKVDAQIAAQHGGSNSGKGAATPETQQGWMHGPAQAGGHQAGCGEGVLPSSWAAMHEQHVQLMQSAAAGVDNDAAAAAAATATAGYNEWSSMLMAHCRHTAAAAAAAAEADGVDGRLPSVASYESCIDACRWQQQQEHQQQRQQQQQEKEKDHSEHNQEQQGCQHEELQAAVAAAQGAPHDTAHHLQAVHAAMGCTTAHAKTCALGASAIGGITAPGGGRAALIARARQPTPLQAWMQQQQHHHHQQQRGSLPTTQGSPNMSAASNCPQEGSAAAAVATAALYDAAGPFALASMHPAATAAAVAAAGAAAAAAAGAARPSGGDLPTLAALVNGATDITECDAEDAWLLDACVSPGGRGHCDAFMEPLIDLF